MQVTNLPLYIHCEVSFSTGSGFDSPARTETGVLIYLDEPKARKTE